MIGSGSDSGDFLDAIGKREEGIGSGHRALERQDGFHGADFAGVYAAHLSRADAYRLAVASVENGVRFHVLADFPGKKQSAFFFGSGLALGDDFRIAVR